MKSRVSASFLAIVPLVLLMTSSNLAAVSSESPGASLIKLLLGKEVKALIQLPATKEGINVYFVPAPGKRTDERGVDLGGLTKWLKSRGVGVDTSEEAAITDIKIDRDRVETDERRGTIPLPHRLLRCSARPSSIGRTMRRGRDSTWQKG